MTIEEIIERAVKTALPPRPDMPEFESGTAIMAWNNAQDEVERVMGRIIEAVCRQAVREALEFAATVAEEPGPAMDAEMRSLYIATAIRALAATLGDKPKGTAGRDVGWS